MATQQDGVDFTNKSPYVFMIELPIEDSFPSKNLSQYVGIQNIKKSTSFQQFMTVSQLLIWKLMWKTFLKMLKIIKKG